MYDADLAAVYDLVYRGRGKDYAAECERLTSIIRTLAPHARSLLDVACGTGSHLRLLREEFAVEGLELSPHMREVAARRAPGVPVHPGDVRDFRLDRRYDAVICMFSSIGYMASTSELTTAITRMAQHLRPGGVLVVEPWYFPGAATAAHVTASIAEEDGHTVIRVSRSVRDGRRVPITVHYLAATAETGIRHFTDDHPMNLYTREEYESAFHAAGCTARYLTEPGFPCGLLVGHRA